MYGRQVPKLLMHIKQEIVHTLFTTILTDEGKLITGKINSDKDPSTYIPNW